MTERRLSMRRRSGRLARRREAGKRAYTLLLRVEDVVSACGFSVLEARRVMRLACGRYIVTFTNAEWERR